MRSSSLFSLTEEEMEEALFAHRGSPVLFGRISCEQILRDLEARGLRARLAARGYRDVRARIERPSPFEEALEVSATHPFADRGKRLVLMVLKAHWGSLRLPAGTFRALVWDWLELMDPMASYTPERAPLPGQSAPGLSMFRPLADLMLGYVTETDAAVLVAVPRNFHNAVLYSRSRFRFVDSLRHGQLLAQIRDLLPQGLARASWAFEEDRVEVLDGESWRKWSWTPSELALGFAPEARAVLESDTPELTRGEALRFRIVS